MKKRPQGDAMGGASCRSSFLGILVRDFGAKGEDFYFCFSSLAERLAAARSGQGSAAFLARRPRTLDGEDRCETISEGGKA
jgi:hypothetical protein